jgi:hypothetical protein
MYVTRPRLMVKWDDSQLKPAVVLIMQRWDCMLFLGPLWMAPQQPSLR